MLRNYKDLQVWQKAYQLCLEIYKGTKEFPKNEQYGITAQIRRAAVSIPSNRGIWKEDNERIHSVFIYRVWVIV